MSQPRLPAVQRRRQLLDVSLDVFAQRGFHAASMAEVAEAAGVTKPVLYQHFGSKRELYLELLDDVGQRLLEEVQKATAAAGGPRQQVAAGFAAYFRFVADLTWAGVRGIRPERSANRRYRGAGDGYDGTSSALGTCVYKVTAPPSRKASDGVVGHWPGR